MFTSGDFQSRAVLKMTYGMDPNKFLRSVESAVPIFYIMVNELLVKDYPLAIIRLDERKSWCPACKQKGKFEVPVYTQQITMTEFDAFAESLAMILPRGSVQKGFGGGLLVISASLKDAERPIFTLKGYYLR